MCSRLSTPTVSEWSFCLHKYDVGNPMVSLLLQFVSVEESLFVLITSYLLFLNSICWSFGRLYPVSCWFIPHVCWQTILSLIALCVGYYQFILVMYLGKTHVHVFCEIQCWSFKITCFGGTPSFLFFKASL